MSACALKATCMSDLAVKTTEEIAPLVLNDIELPLGLAASSCGVLYA
jgi:hypothetical protein